MRELETAVKTRAGCIERMVSSKLLVVARCTHPRYGPLAVVFSLNGNKLKNFLSSIKHDSRAGSLPAENKPHWLLTTNMQLAQSAGKYVTVAKRGKISKWCQAREISNCCQGQKNIQVVPRARKYPTGAKRGKTCSRCQARENIQLVPSAGKHAHGAIVKRGNRRKQPTAFCLFVCFLTNHGAQ